MYFISDRLSAQDLLTIRKVRQYVHDRITEDKDEEPVSMEDRGSNISITCADQVCMHMSRPVYTRTCSRCVLR